MIGVDEAGRGPVIGPLVVAALAIPSEDIEILSELNVKDSKDLSPNERLGIFTAINQRIEDGKWKSGLILCSPKRIDINSLTSDLNSLEIDLFSEAILATDLYLNSGVIRADACDVNENRFRIRLQSSLGEKWKAWRIIAEHGMDSKDLVTGGASILAKVSRDSAIEEIATRTGLQIGSGYPSDKTTRVAVEKCSQMVNHMTHLDGLGQLYLIFGKGCMELLFLFVLIRVERLYNLHLMTGKGDKRQMSDFGP